VGGVKRDAWLIGALVGCALVVRLLTALPLQQPGYMDAYYYYETAQSLYRGDGFNEDFLWNYLDDPAGLPHPSHLYWMPLTSLLVWPAFAILSASYRAAQLPFILLSALLPTIAWWVAMEITGKRRQAFIAGLLAIFSGFYMHFWVSPDAFTPFALVGSLCLVTAYKGLQSGRPLWFLLAGALAGLGHLARADGALLLGVILVPVFDEIGGVSRAAFRGLRTYPKSSLAPCGRRAQGPMLRGQSIIRLTLLLVGYLLVMAPWFYRNWQVVGVILPMTGAKTIFLRDYDDFFSYGQDLSLQSYLAWGLWPILRSKLWAAWVNTLTVIGVFCLVFLAPFTAIGLWRMRHHALLRLATLYGVLLWVIMTFIFTFPGPRGGLFHSGTVLLPFVYTASLAGLEGAVVWVAERRRGWDPAVAGQVFAWGLPLLALLSSGIIYNQRVLRGSLTDPAWNHADRAYTDIAEWLDTNAPPDTIVMAGNPPSFLYHSGRRSIAVPNADLETTLKVCQRYGVTYLVLDRNSPRPLAAVYHGEVSHPALILRLTVDGGAADQVKLFQAKVRVQ
jgi:hypothetical protein